MSSFNVVRNFVTKLECHFCFNNIDDIFLINFNDKNHLRCGESWIMGMCEDCTYRISEFREVAEIKNITDSFDIYKIMLS